DGLDDDPESPHVQMVSGNYYSGLGVNAEIGRLMTDDDDKDSAVPVAVIGHRYWENQYGRNPNAIGKTINLGGTLFTIIGVTPGSFVGTLDLGDAPDIVIPLSMADRIGSIGPKFTDVMKQQPWLWAVMIMARMRPGVTYDAVKEELQDPFTATALEG